jgi:hypothetical protein
MTHRVSISTRDQQLVLFSCFGSREHNQEIGSFSIIGYVLGFKKSSY